MEVRQRRLVTGILAAMLLVAPLAEAKRAGSGKSHGMQRSATPTQSAQPQSYQQSPSTNMPQAPMGNQTAQRSGSGVGGMVAAGVAGAAVGAIAANALADDTPASQATTQNAPAVEQAQPQAAEEEKGGIPGWIWLILIAAVGFFLFRKFSAKKPTANPYAPNHGAAPSPSFPQTPPPSQGGNSNIFGQNVGGATSNAPTFGGAAYTQSGNTLPDGTEPATFLRVARQRFNHIQSMNNASNIAEIQRYLTPDLYQSMYNDIMANQDHDIAEFSNLNAMVAESTTENGQYIVSVRFTGTVSEDLNSIPQPFTEIWHFVKPVGSQQDWLVAGIQQA